MGPIKSLAGPGNYLCRQPCKWSLLDGTADALTICLRSMCLQTRADLTFVDSRLGDGAVAVLGRALARRNSRSKFAGKQE